MWEDTHQEGAQLWSCHVCSALGFYHTSLPTQNHSHYFLNHTCHTYNSLKGRKNTGSIAQPLPFQPRPNTNPIQQEINILLFLITLFITQGKALLLHQPYFQTVWTPSARSGVWFPVSNKQTGQQPQQQQNHTDCVDSGSYFLLSFQALWLLILEVW